MNPLLQISEPSSIPSSSPTFGAFLEMGFRPLYLAGSAWAAIAVAIWVFVPQYAAGILGGVAWHAHEMLWGFVATIAVGFLFTAGANWTGINPLRGKPLLLIVALWSGARIGFLVGGMGMFRLATLLELAFFALATTAMGRAITKSRNRRNYGVPILVLALGTSDALFLCAAAQGDYVASIQYFNTGLLCMTVLTLLIGRRVIPFFASRAIEGLQIPIFSGCSRLQMPVSAIAVVCALLDWRLATSVTVAIAACVTLLQFALWKPLAVRHKPILWILYVGYASLAIGLLFAAAHYGGLPIRAAVHVHIIALGGFSLLIIGMITRTALGHLGRPLVLDDNMLWSYGLILAAATLRLLALMPGAYAVPILRLSAVAWIAAMVLYIWRFLPMMIRPRLPATPAKTGAVPVAVRTR